MKKVKIISILVLLLVVILTILSFIKLPIKTLTNDRSLREDMGAYNREKAVKMFDSKRMVSEYKAVFSS